MFVVRLADRDGNLWPGYRELSEAAAKSLLELTDWERRTLGAARWLHLATTAVWPSAPLVAAMSAMDALLCFPRDRRNKDRIIADRLGRFHATVRGVTDVEAWFRALYGRWRNNAAHDARFYLEDREIGRLLELTDRVVRWAVSHLDPDHRIPSGACTTIDQAHAQPHDEE